MESNTVYSVYYNVEGYYIIEETINDKVWNKFILPDELLDKLIDMRKAQKALKRKAKRG